MVDLKEIHVAVGDLVKGPAVVVEPKTTLRGVATTLGDLGIGIVAVMDAGKLVGVVSERDLVWAIAREADIDEVWAADVMTLDILSVAPSTPLAKAAEMMSANKARHIFVDYPDVPGVVSMRDIFDQLVSG